jgi:hypothetical protein
MIPKISGVHRGMNMAFPGKTGNIKEIKACSIIKIRRCSTMDGDLAIGFMFNILSSKLLVA